MTFPLTDKDKDAYLAWLLRSGASESNDYDMPGFFKAMSTGDPRAAYSVNPNDGQMHYTDAFKLPNHETFSRDSRYANASAPQWFGGGLLSGGESWSNYGKDGLVVSEAPWNKGGVRRANKLGLLSLFGLDDKGSK